jgi:hypothetical protein
VATAGTFVLRDITDMLAKCAPGYVVEAHGKHKLRVKWRNKLYYNLPKGDSRQATGPR